jgi:GNAT superfamily N-acetyltransferase
VADNEMGFACTGDIAQLCELLAELFLQEAEFHPDAAKQTAGLRMIIENAELGRILVVREGDRLVGMVTLLFTVSTAEGGRAVLLEDMVVRATARGRGLGRKLLRQAIQFAREAGFVRITLLTDRVNRDARRFYEREGFSLSPMVPLRLRLG